jgi:hypothetical protein
VDDFTTTHFWGRVEGMVGMAEGGVNRGKQGHPENIWVGYPIMPPWRLRPKTTLMVTDRQLGFSAQLSLGLEGVIRVMKTTLIKQFFMGNPNPVSNFASRYALRRYT